MPLSKFIANRAMSFMDELVLGIEMSEFHSGFRMYTRKLLENVPFRQNSDDYLFSFEIIVQAVYWGFKVAEVLSPAVIIRQCIRLIFAAALFMPWALLKRFGSIWRQNSCVYQRGPF